MPEPLDKTKPLSSRVRLLKALIPLLLSLLFVHAPLFYFIMTHSFIDTPLSQQNKQQVTFVKLNQPNLPVVDIPRPSIQQRPKKASAQALYDQTVPKETVAKQFSKQNVPLGMPPQPQVPSQNQQQPPPKQTQKFQPVVEVAKQQVLEDQLKSLVNEQKYTEQKKYTQRYGQNTNVPPSIRSSIGSPTGGTTDDYLPNYQLGNRTYLNTLANPNMAYYVELRRKFRFAWDPAPVLRNQINQIARGQISVVWGVSVGPGGQLADLKLIQGSGNLAYDNEARRTIMASSPFTTPPIGMLGDDGMLHMAWTFVVYL